MARRKGELSKYQIDIGWPHQVAVPLIEGQSFGYVNASGPLSSLCRRGHEVCHEGTCYRVFCFSDRDQAARFKNIMGGVEFDPRDRGRGHNWNTWYRGRGAGRDALRKLRSR